MSKEQIECVDYDFLDNKINIGDEVIFQDLEYREFVIGKVITKAKKSCQIEYVGKSGMKKGRVCVSRQGYNQIIKQRFGEWLKHVGEQWYSSESYRTYTYYKCSICDGFSEKNTDFCPNCGAKMKGE